MKVNTAEQGHRAARSGLQILTTIDLSRRRWPNLSKRHPPADLREPQHLPKPGTAASRINLMKSHAMKSDVLPVCAAPARAESRCQETAITAPRPTHVRHVILGLTAAAYMITY